MINYFPELNKELLYLLYQTTIKKSSNESEESINALLIYLHKGWEDNKDQHCLFYLIIFCVNFYSSNYYNFEDALHLLPDKTQKLLNYEGACSYIDLLQGLDFSVIEPMYLFAIAININYQLGVDISCNNDICCHLHLYNHQKMLTLHETTLTLFKIAQEKQPNSILFKAWPFLITPQEQDEYKQLHTKLRTAIYTFIFDLERFLPPSISWCSEIKSSLLERLKNR